MYLHQDDCQSRLATKRQAASQHLEKDDTQSIYIATTVNITLPRGLLRAQVSGCAAFQWPRLASSRNLGGNPKVSQVWLVFFIE